MTTPPACWKVTKRLRARRSCRLRAARCARQSPRMTDRRALELAEPRHRRRPAERLSDGRVRSATGAATRSSASRPRRRARGAQILVVAHRSRQTRSRAMRSLPGQEKRLDLTNGPASSAPGAGTRPGAGADARRAHDLFEPIVLRASRGSTPSDGRAPAPTAFRRGTSRTPRRGTRRRARCDRPPRRSALRRRQLEPSIAPAELDGAMRRREPGNSAADDDDFSCVMSDRRLSVCRHVTAATRGARTEIGQHRDDSGWSFTARRATELRARDWRPRARLDVEA